jgi:hypothetical protein
VSDSKEVFLSVHTHLRFSAEKYSMQTLPLSHKFKFSAASLRPMFNQRERTHQEHHTSVVV